MATAIVGSDKDLRRRIRLHRERRPAGWGTVEVDSLTLWVAAHAEEQALAEFDDFLDGAKSLDVPFLLVSDEVGLGVVPESEAGRKFRDTLGLVNQRAATAAEEVHLCVAGIGVRIK